MTTDHGAVGAKQQPLLALGKIIEILDPFSLACPSLTLGEIQLATKLPASTVQRLVSNMAAQGLLDREGDQIRIGVQMSFGAAAIVKDLDVLSILQPVLNQIRDETTETASFFKVQPRLPSVCCDRGNAAGATSRYVHRQGHPFGCGFASRVLLAWNPDLVRSVLSSSAGTADRRNRHQPGGTSRAHHAS